MDQILAQTKEMVPVWIKQNQGWVCLECDNTAWIVWTFMLVTGGYYAIKQQKKKGKAEPQQHVLNCNLE